MSRLRNQRIIDAKKVKSRRGKGGSRVQIRDRKQKFITSAIAAKKQFGTNAYVISQFSSGGSRILYYINQANPTNSGLKLRYTPIYSVSGNRKADIRRTNYLSQAGEMSAKKMDNFFRKSAERQFKKALRK